MEIVEWMELHRNSVISNYLIWFYRQQQQQQTQEKQNKEEKKNWKKNNDIDIDMT